jgi:outer membrane immunogenic protein
MEDRMKKILVAGLAMSALLGGSAGAADLGRPPPPVYAPPPPLVAMFTWTGCYVGGNGGGVWATRTWTDQTLFLAGADLGSNNSESGGIGGLQGGCNYQVGGWVFGLQGDYDWASANQTNAPAILLPFGISTYSKLKSLGSVTGRVGYSFDRFLGYVKGGGAWEKSDYSLLVAGLAAATATESRSGWTIGVGGEYAFLNWLTGFVEYDYYGFGNNSAAFVCAPTLVACGTGVVAPAVNVKTNVNVLKVGVNFKFP